MSQKNNKANIIIISGPSGVGKSTICKKIVEQLDNVCLSVSATTRQKSELEEDGKNYWFISKKDFLDKIQKGLFLEYAEVFGQLYGTLKEKVDETLESGKSIILEIDVQGAKQVKTLYPKAVMIFILPPDSKVLAQRMKNRGRDADEAVERRLQGAGIEIAAAWQYYEHMVVNEDLQQAVDECIQIIKQVENESF